MNSPELIELAFVMILKVTTENEQEEISCEIYEKSGIEPE